MPNKAKINSLKPTGKQYSVGDSTVRDLVLMVSPKGAKTFFLYRKVHGRPERIRRCPVHDVRLVALVNNTVRGAAGASILNAELMVRKGLIGARSTEVRKVS